MSAQSERLTCTTGCRFDCLNNRLSALPSSLGQCTNLSNLKEVGQSNVETAELAKKSRKLILISELSGLAVKLIDGGLDSTEKIIQLSGTPEQAERAQSLLQGFILSRYITGKKKGFHASL
ncbi:hypothetical protein ACS0TY_033786 [Phlomoides rotata]